MPALFPVGDNRQQTDVNTVRLVYTRAVLYPTYEKSVSRRGQADQLGLTIFTIPQVSTPSKFGTLQAERSGSPSGDTQPQRHGGSGTGDARSDGARVAEEGRRQDAHDLVGMSYRYCTCDRRLLRRSQNDVPRSSVATNMETSKRR